MRCVYYMWQLVFADIINNTKLSTMYHYLIVLTTWLYIWFWYRLSLLIHVCYVGHPMIHMTWLDIWLYYWCPYYGLFMFCIVFQPYSSIYYHHMLTRYMHVHLPLYFTYSLGHFLMTLNLHVQIRCFILLFRCSIDCICCEKLKSLSYGLSVFLLFYLCYFLILSISYPVIFHFLFICYHVWIFILPFISYCSDHDLL